MQKILITGGSGLIASILSEKLESIGHTVSFLSRKKKRTTTNPVFRWDIPSQFIEDGSLQGIDHIIHLAGAGIADRRWSDSRKEEIEASRVEGANLLFEKLQTSKHNVRSFISASAVGLYEKNRDEILTEKSPPAADYLGQICEKWEAAAERFIDIGMRVVKIRTGIVLSPRGGALPKMAAPVKMMIGSPLGTGEQFVPWIDMDDLCGIYIKAIEDEQMRGFFNAVSPNPVSNGELTKVLARVLKRPLFCPNVPAFVLKIIFGEMAQLLLDGQKVSSKKIEEAGFQFKYPELEASLIKFYKKN